MKDISEMSQFTYERLLTAIAGALRTQRRFLTIESETRIAPHIVQYKVKRRGSYHRYLVSAMEMNDKIKVENRGLII